MLLETVNDIYRYAQGLGIFAPDHEAMRMYNRNLVDLDDSFAEQAKADFYALARQRAVRRVTDPADKVGADTGTRPTMTGLPSMTLLDLRARERELRGRLQRETEVVHG